MIKKLSRNRKALIKNRGTLEILINGYDDDPREIYEIPEVRKWYFESIKKGVPWLYFLGLEIDGMSLAVTLFSTSDITVVHDKNGQKYVEFADPEQIFDWLDANFRNLNHFTNLKNIPEEINKEMSLRANTLLKNSGSRRTLKMRL